MKVVRGGAPGCEEAPASPIVHLGLQMLLGELQLLVIVVLMLLVKMVLVHLSNSCC